MKDNREQELKRRHTQAFLDRSPETIELVFSREDLVWSEGSFTRTNPHSIPGQHLRLIASAVQLPVRISVAGESITPEYIMIGRWDADMQRGDWFYLEGVKYEVVFVHPSRSFETRAEVAYRG